MIKVSVLLPVYNAQNFVAGAIDSILSQSYTDFEFIIINDGSTDKSEEIIKKYTDPRIRYYSNDGNQGLIYTLNRGINLAQGKYIARMDADDISVSERFSEQVLIMEQNPDIVVCGAQIIKFGQKKRRKIVRDIRKYEQNSVDNKQRLIFDPCFAHPVTMIRKSVLEDNNIYYDKEYLCAEDFKMWIDLSKCGEFYNIQKFLLYYRQSDSQITTGNNPMQLTIAKKCRRLFIERNFSTEVQKMLLSEKITIMTIKKMQQHNNNYLLLLCWLSLSDYNFKNLCYYLFSCMWMHFSFYYNMCVLKRFVKGTNPLL